MSASGGLVSGGRGLIGLAASRVIAALGQALLQVGLPVALLTWLLLARLFQRGTLDRAQTTKSLEQDLQSWQKAQKQSGESASIVQRKWLQYGGGFYGAAGLWTLLVIELNNFWTFITDFAGYPPGS